MAALKEEYGIDIAYSFGPTANLVKRFFRNASVPKKEGQTGQKSGAGVRSYMDMGNPRLLRLFCRYSDRVVSCSKLIQRELEARFSCQKVCTLYNPFELAGIQAQAREVGEKERLPFAGCGRVIVSMDARMT